MNSKYMQKAKNVLGRPGIAVLLVVIMIGTGTLLHFTGDFDQTANTTTIDTADNNSSYHRLDNNTCQRLNGTVVYENVSENQSIQDVYCKIS